MMGTFAVAALKWLWPRKWYVLIVIIAAACCIALGVRLWRANDRANDYQRQLANYDVVTQLHEGAYLAQTARLDLAETLIREYSPQPGTQVAYECKATIEYQTRTIRVPVAETKIVYRDRYIDIDGRVISDDGPDVAQSVTGLEMTYTIKPLALDLFVTRGPDGEYATIVDTHDPAITIGRMKTRLDPAVFHDDRHWFAGGGPLVRLRDFKVRDFGATDLGVAGQIGYTGGRWFVAAQVQYLDGFGVGLMAGGRF